MSRLALQTLGVAVVITVVLRVIGYPDLTRIFSVMLTASSGNSSTQADLGAWVLAILVWWGIAYFVARRLARRPPKTVKD